MLFFVDSIDILDNNNISFAGLPSGDGITSKQQERIGQHAGWYREGGSHSGSEPVSLRLRVR